MPAQYPSELIRQITELLFIETPKDELLPVDLVIVFGSNYIDGTVDAIEEALSRSLLKKNGKIILSGATRTLNAGEEKEAIQLYNEAIRRSMDPSLFMLETKATNALENLLFSKEIIEDKLGGFSKFEHIMFIGKSFLLRRAQMGASALGYPLDKIQYWGLVDPTRRNISAESWWEQEESRTRVLQEVERIGKYAAKGDISIF